MIAPSFSKLLVPALAAAAFLLSISEGCGRPVKRWRLLLLPTVAALAALALIALPSLADLKRPGMWIFALMVLVAGMLRGYLVSLEVDNFWHIVRLQRAPDGMLASALLLALAIAETITDLRNKVETPYHPTLELGMVLVASYLVGRNCMAWERVRHQPHVDLRPTTEQPPSA